MDEHTLPLKTNQMWIWKKHPNVDTEGERYLVNKQFPTKVLDRSKKEAENGWFKLTLFPATTDPAENWNQRFEKVGDKIKCPGNIPRL